MNELINTVASQPTNLNSSSLGILGTKQLTKSLTFRSLLRDCNKDIVFFGYDAYSPEAVKGEAVEGSYTICYPQLKLVFSSPSRILWRACKEVN